MERVTCLIPPDWLALIETLFNYAFVVIFVYMWSHLNKIKSNIVCVIIL